MSSNVTFLLFGTSPHAARELSESFMATVVSRYPNVSWADISGRSYLDIQELHTRLKVHGSTPVVYIRECVLPRSIHEAWLRDHTTYGMLRQNPRMRVVVLESSQELVTHAMTVLEAEGQAPKPKEASEVQRLSVQQKQEDLLMKKRQQDQMLQAKQRELSKKSREASQKLTQPKTGAQQE